MTNKTQKILTLSTAHLHPLEAQVIDQLSFLCNETSNLIHLSNDVIQIAKQKSLVCLAELLEMIIDRHKDEVDFVLFDPDEQIVDEFKVYDW